MQYKRKEPNRELKRKRTGESYKELLVQKFKLLLLVKLQMNIGYLTTKVTP
jgi:hypothetical protein